MHLRKRLRSTTILVLAAFLAQDVARAAVLVPSPANTALDPSFLNVPASAAKITETFRGDGQRLLIHVQDAHMNLSAQQNLAKVLEALIRDEGVKTVFMEGGTQDDSLTALRTLAPKEARERVAKQYLVSGQLNGAEYLNLASDYDMTLWGIERPELYRENLDQYIAVAARREAVLDYLAEIRKRVSMLNRRVYTAEALAFDSFLEAFERKEKNFTEYFAELKIQSTRQGVNLLGYPHFLSLSQLQSKEERIDFKKANDEQAELANLVLGSDMALAHRIEKLRSDSPTPLSFYDALLKEAVSKKIDVSRYAELRKYVDYLETYEKIDLKRLSDESQAIEREIFSRLSPDPDAFYLHEISECLKQAKKLYSLQISKEEFDAYAAMKSERRFETPVMLGFLNRKLYQLGNAADVMRYEPLIEDTLKDARAFYDTTEKRDAQFLSETLGKMDTDGLTVAVLVTGGYHTPHLKNLLRQRGISYAIVTPHVENETNLKRYEEILFGGSGKDQPKLEMASAEADGDSIAVRSFMDRGLAPKLAAEFGTTSLPASSAAAARLAKIETHTVTLNVGKEMIVSSGDKELRLVTRKIKVEEKSIVMDVVDANNSASVKPVSIREGKKPMVNVAGVHLTFKLNAIVSENEASITLETPTGFNVSAARLAEDGEIKEAGSFVLEENFSNLKVFKKQLDILQKRFAKFVLLYPPDSKNVMITALNNFLPEIKRNTTIGLRDRLRRDPELKKTRAAAVNQEVDRFLKAVEDQTKITPEDLTLAFTESDEAFEERLKSLRTALAGSAGTSVTGVLAGQSKTVAVTDEFQNATVPLSLMSNLENLSDVKKRFLDVEGRLLKIAEPFPPATKDRVRLDYTAAKNVLDRASKLLGDKNKKAEEANSAIRGLLSSMSQIFAGDNSLQPALRKALEEGNAFFMRRLALRDYQAKRFLVERVARRPFELKESRVLGQTLNETVDLIFQALEQDWKLTGPNKGLLDKIKNSLQQYAYLDLAMYTQRVEGAFQQLEKLKPHSPLSKALDEVATAILDKKKEMPTYRINSPQNEYWVDVVPSGSAKVSVKFSRRKDGTNSLEKMVAWVMPSEQIGSDPTVAIVMPDKTKTDIADRERVREILKAALSRRMPLTAPESVRVILQSVFNSENWTTPSSSGARLAEAEKNIELKSALKQNVLNLLLNHARPSDVFSGEIEGETFTESKGQETLDKLRDTLNEDTLYDALFERQPDGNVTLIVSSGARLAGIEYNTAGFTVRVNESYVVAPGDKSDIADDPLVVSVESLSFEDRSITFKIHKYSSPADLLQNPTLKAGEHFVFHYAGHEVTLSINEVAVGHARIAFRKPKSQVYISSLAAFERQLTGQTSFTVLKADRLFVGDVMNLVGSLTLSFKYISEGKARVTVSPYGRPTEILQESEIEHGKTFYIQPPSANKRIRMVVNKIQPTLVHLWTDQGSFVSLESKLPDIIVEGARLANGQKMLDDVLSYYYANRPDVGTRAKRIVEQAKSPVSGMLSYILRDEFVQQNTEAVLSLLESWAGSSPKQFHNIQERLHLILEATKLRGWSLHPEALSGFNSLSGESLFDAIDAFSDVLAVRNQDLLPILKPLTPRASPAQVAVIDQKKNIWFMKDLTDVDAYLRIARGLVPVFKDDQLTVGINGKTYEMRNFQSFEKLFGVLEFGEGPSGPPTGRAGARLSDMAHQRLWPNPSYGLLWELFAAGQSETLTTQLTRTDLGGELTITASPVYTGHIEALREQADQASIPYTSVTSGDKNVATFRLDNKNYNFTEARARERGWVPSGPPTGREGARLAESVDLKDAISEILQWKAAHKDALNEPVEDNPFLTLLQVAARNIYNQRKVYALAPKDRLRFVKAVFDGERFENVNVTVESLYREFVSDPNDPAMTLTPGQYNDLSRKFSSYERLYSIGDYSNIRVAVNLLFDFFEIENNVYEQLALIHEIDKELDVPGSGDLPTIAAIQDLHNGGRRFMSLVGHTLGLPENVYTKIKTLDDLKRLLVTHNIDIKKSNLRFVGLADQYDRGPDPIGVADTVRWLRGEGKAKFFVGNHDDWRIWAVLQVNKIFEKRGIDYENEENKGHHIAYWAKEAAVHTGWMDIEFDQINQTRFNEAVDAINRLIDLANEGRTGPKIARFSKIALDRVRNRFEQDLKKKKKKNQEIRTQKQQNPDDKDIQAIPFEILPDIFQETLKHLDLKINEYNRRIDRINSRDQLTLPKISIEAVDLDNFYRDHEVIQRTLWELKNFRLFYVDQLGNLQIHNILPIKEDGGFDVQYGGREGLEALELMSQRVREFFEDWETIPDDELFREKMWSELGEIFEIINSWYSDKPGFVYSKAGNVKAFIDKGGLERLGVGILGHSTQTFAPRKTTGFIIMGHNERQKFEGEKSNLPYIFPYPELGSGIINIDYELSPGYSDRGAILTFLKRDKKGAITGMRLWGYRNGSSTIEDLTFEDVKGLDENQLKMIRMLADGKSYLKWQKRKTLDSLNTDLSQLAVLASQSHRSDKAAKFQTQLLDVRRRAMADAMDTSTSGARLSDGQARFASPDRNKEVQEARALSEKLTAPLNTEDPRVEEGGFGRVGFGVPSGAAVNGSFATSGSQGYYVAKNGSGKRAFLENIKAMSMFFWKRNAKLSASGKAVQVVVKIGIGGQHTPFQGIAELFNALPGEKPVFIGEYELGKDFEATLGRLLDERKAGWDQVVVIPSSKSGSTDETMIIFGQIFSILLKKIAESRYIDGKSFSKLVLDTLHEINVTTEGERKGSELFRLAEGQNFVDLLAQRAPRYGLGSLTRSQIRGILGTVLGNFFFETTDRVEKSRLSAFVRNSGLDRELSGEAPGFGAMFDNVGGRWTADLHIMPFLAANDLTGETYWQTRQEGLREVLQGRHRGVELANLILDGKITDIALVVPDELFWFGKSIEQNFNESIWQEGFANLITIKASHWNAQKHHYRRSTKLVINLSNVAIGGETAKTVKIDIFDKPVEDAKDLSQRFAKLTTIFYGMTAHIGNRLIVRALYRNGYQVSDVDLNQLDHPATRIVQDNLYLLQKYVELGKGLLDQEFAALQEKEKENPGAIEEKVRGVQTEAKSGRLVTNIEGKNFPEYANDVDALASAMKQAVAVAKAQGRKFVPFIYLEGEKFQKLRDVLTQAGYEWVLQGTGDQHISYQQVLANPSRFLVMVVSAFPETDSKVLMNTALPAIGFAKAGLHNAPPVLIRDGFAEASYKALTELRREQGGLGLFLRISDSDQSLARLQRAFLQASSTLSSGARLAEESAEEVPTYAPVVGDESALTGFQYDAATNTADWYEQNLGADGLTSLELSENAVVLDASTGSGAALLRVLRGSKIGEAIAVDIDLPKELDLVSYAPIALEPVADRVGKPIRFYRLFFNKAEKRFASLLSIPDVTGKADVVLFENAMHLVPPSQRVSLMKQFYDVLKPGGLLIAGSGNIEHEDRGDMILLDDTFKRVRLEILNLLAEGKYPSASLHVAGFDEARQEENQKSVKAFLPTPPSVADAVAALNEAGFDVTVKTSHTTIKRTDYRPFLTGIDGYTKRIFPEIRDVEEHLRVAIINEAYDRVFDKGDLTMLWTSIRAVKPAISGARLSDGFENVIAEKIAYDGIYLAGLIRSAEDPLQTDIKADMEKMINAKVDEINILEPRHLEKPTFVANQKEVAADFREHQKKKLKEIENIETPRSELQLGDFIGTEGHRAYRETAEQKIVDGFYVPELIFAGAATRLLSDLEAVTGRKLDPTAFRMYGLNLWQILQIAKDADDAKLREVLKDEEAALFLETYKVPDIALPTGNGPRQILAYRLLVEELADRHGVSHTEALSKQRLVMHINEEIADQVLEDFQKHDFYGFNPDNVYFLIQPVFYGYKLVVDKNAGDGSTVRYEIDPTSPKLPFGHGYAVMQTNMPGAAFTLGKDGVRKTVDGTVLQRLVQSDPDGRSVIGMHRINDLTKFKTDEVVDLDKLAYSLYLMEKKGAGVTLDLVENPLKAKGGVPARYKGREETFLIETSNSKGSAYLTQMVDEAGEAGAPYSPMRFVTTPAKLEELLKIGLPYNLRYKAGRFYLEAVTGDMTQSAESKFMAFEKKDDLIHDFKELKNLAEALQFAEKQDVVLSAHTELSSLLNGASSVQVDPQNWQAGDFVRTAKGTGTVVLTTRGTEPVIVVHYTGMKAKSASRDSDIYTVNEARAAQKEGRLVYSGKSRPVVLSEKTLDEKSNLPGLHGEDLALDELNDYLKGLASQLIPQAGIEQIYTMGSALYLSDPARRLKRSVLTELLNDLDVMVVVSQPLTEDQFETLGKGLVNGLKEKGLHTLVNIDVVEAGNYEEMIRKTTEDHLSLYRNNFEDGSSLEVSTRQLAGLKEVQGKGRLVQAKEYIKFEQIFGDQARASLELGRVAVSKNPGNQLRATLRRAEKDNRFAYLEEQMKSDEAASKVEQWFREKLKPFGARLAELTETPEALGRALAPALKALLNAKTATVIPILSTDNVQSPLWIYEFTRAADGSVMFTVKEANPSNLLDANTLQKDVKVSDRDIASTKAADTQRALARIAAEPTPELAPVLSRSANTVADLQSIVRQTPVLQAFSFYRPESLNLWNRWAREAAAMRSSAGETFVLSLPYDAAFDEEGFLNLVDLSTVTSVFSQILSTSQSFKGEVLVAFTHEGVALSSETQSRVTATLLNIQRASGNGRVRFGLANVSTDERLVDGLDAYLAGLKLQVVAQSVGFDVDRDLSTVLPEAGERETLKVFAVQLPGQNEVISAAGLVMAGTMSFDLHKTLADLFAEFAQDVTVTLKNGLKLFLVKPRPITAELKAVLLSFRQTAIAA